MRQAVCFLLGVHPTPRRHTGPPGAAQPFSIHPCPALPCPSQCGGFQPGLSVLTLTRGYQPPSPCQGHSSFPKLCVHRWVIPLGCPGQQQSISPASIPAQRWTQSLLMSVQFLGRDGMFWDSPSSWEKARLGSSSLQSVGLCLHKYYDRDFFSERLCAGIVHSLGK